MIQTGAAQEQRRSEVSKHAGMHLFSAFYEGRLGEVRTVVETGQKGKSST